MKKSRKHDFQHGVITRGFCLRGKILAEKEPLATVKGATGDMHPTRSSLLFLCRLLCKWCSNNGK